MSNCKAINCNNHTVQGHDFCLDCQSDFFTGKKSESVSPLPLSERYPQYYKSVGDLTEIDVYATHMLFNIQDPSGCIQHASKKLLLSGVRTGGKSAYKDITEARDTINRWLQLNENNQ